jgi:tRNA nucleotidyltransferase (CCA-adding enzyme)
LIATYDLPIGLDHLDFATARHETYPTPAALPVVQPGTFTEDLARRDFTINTLAARLPGWEGIDLQGGLADLENGVIRTLHARSFEDDPTRIFRAIRYQTRLDFHLDPLTRKQLIEGIPLIDRLTGERVQHELLKMLREDSALGMLLNLDRVGVWRQLDRGLPDSTRLALVFEGMSQAVALFGECDETLRLTVILAAAVMPERVIRRLHFLEALTPVEKCVGVTERLRLQPTQPSGWVRALDGCDAGVLRILYVLNPEHREGIGRYWREWRHIKPSLTGADLKKMGLQPSPLFGKILGGLRDALVDKRITTSEDERRLLTQWIASGYPE